MKICQKADGSRAFTVLELFVVVVVILVVFAFIALLLPAFAKAKPHSRGNCVNNLKQVGLSFRIWAGDNGDMYPMQALAKKEYGSFELNATNGFRYFQIMSNELSTPWVLICPADLKRKRATNFTTDFNNPHVGYFIGLDSDETRPQTFLAGDWNLTNGQSKSNGVLFLQTNQNVGWTKELHNQTGNILLGDGSVQQIPNDQIKAALAKTGLVTNRFLFP